MGDSSLQASSSSNNNAGATNPAQTSQATGSSQTGPKLNPAAKDYVPRTPINESAVNNSSAANTNGRNRRRRNPETANAAAGAADGSQTAAKSSDNTQANRNRRNRVRPPKQSTGGGARIDDDLDDGSVITMERPVETTEGQPAGSGQGPNGVRRERRDGRDGRRKGKEVVNNSSPKPQQTRGDNARTRPPRNESQAGTSSSARGSGSGSNSNNINNNNNNRRQRDRKGDLGGRTFPTSAHNHAHPEESSSSSQKTPSRPRPAKFVHTVEEDRDLLAALTAGLSNSSYDCMVCWDVIRPAHKIWNCQVCWAAFHLDCLSTWAKKSSEDSGTTQAGWRCPGCQNTQVSIPKEYSCFCGKVNNPDFNRYLTPHSCGELCGRSRDCPHPCNIPCHPGPCPPCGGLGPIQSCHCGNDSFQLRCVDTDFTFQTGKSCDKVCGELMGCGKHTCSSVCHAGLCPPCEETQEQRCYCGKHERTARCGDGLPKTTVVDGQEQTGYYQCADVCERMLACGHHKCTKKCHLLDDEPGQCPAMPSAVTTCPCGSKSVDMLLKGQSRTACTDPIPLCGGLCKKDLKCGHRCMQKCHLGECAPCRMTVKVDCRCGATQIQRVCSDMGLYGDDLPTCDRPCRGLRACGKHQCTNKCCPAKNQPKTKKGDMAAHEAHICTLVCGKKLQCGVHTCEMLCHKGHCNPCLNASFDELSCACGRTVLYPPIACGTPIPKCRYTCTRQRTCGHASLSNHPCHPDSEPCPPCIMLVAKQCMCKKSKMPNVPCYKSNPSCGKICGRRLECGLHSCNKSCHSGECATPPESCSQPCPKARKSCGHRCGVACHGQDPCPEDQSCQTTVPSSCKCGHLTMESACNASAENPWDGKSRVIKCNDYCLIAERNKRVALALDIDETVEKGPRIPDYDDYVLDYASANMDFTLKMEKQLAEWVADTSKPILHLPPMKGHRRKFVHELAAHYDVTSESVDVEPYRSVSIRRNLNTSVPDLLASQACRQKRTSGMASSGGLEQLRKTSIRDPVNAIYLHDLAFGLTRSELASQLAPVFGNIKYGIRWLTDDDAVLVPHPGSLQMDELEAVLVRLRTGIKAVVAKSSLCERVELCWVNKEGDVVSHTNVGGPQAKRFFNASTGSQLLKKPASPTVANAFALLDDDERIAAAKRAEEERILKAKEAAGTLSMDAWEEASSSSPSVPLHTHTTDAKASRPSSAQSGSQADTFSETTEDLTKFVVVESGEFTGEVVDDWQDLLDDDDSEEEPTKKEEGEQPSVQAQSESGIVETKEVTNKNNSDDEAVLVDAVETVEQENQEDATEKLARG